MSISDNIKAIRTQKGIPQAEVARRLEIEPSSYHRLENRGDKLTLEQVDSIAQALGITRLELLTLGNEKTATATSDEIIQLRNRIIELEKQVELYIENRTSKTDQEKYQTFLFNYLLDNVLWDIAFNYHIIKPEEAEKYGVLTDGELKHWMMEDYWELINEEDGTSYHPYASKLLTEEQLNQALSILFSLIWVREIINQVPDLYWFKEKLEKWEAIQRGKFRYNGFYTYKGDYPELDQKSYLYGGI